jgi:hypothetical protein
MAETFSPELRAAVKQKLDSLLLGIPELKAGQAFGYPCYKIGSKIFTFIGSAGVSIKLPAPQVKALTEQQPQVYQIVEVEKGVFWREWLLIRRAQPDDYEQDLPLLEESMRFVATGRPS